jgi:negative regulator of sigma E activity
MKCHEFITAAECLTPSQLALMRSNDCSLSAHARECAGCGRWLESQCVLGNAMQSLRASTAQSEAGAGVEQAIMLSFRNQEFAFASGAAPDRAAPVVWKLSRFFEFAAYAAVAAALVMAAFLGSRILRDRQATLSTVKTQATGTHPGAESMPAAAEKVASSQTQAPEAAKPVTAKSRAVRTTESQPATARPAAASAENDGFVALMLCDPLICSGDEQVIRMELPGSSAASPVLADVVVGDDGLVRAMRIVN